MSHFFRKGQAGKKSCQPFASEQIGSFAVRGSFELVPSEESGSFKVHFTSNVALGVAGAVLTVSTPPARQDGLSQYR